MTFPGPGVWHRTLKLRLECIPEDLEECGVIPEPPPVHEVVPRDGNKLLWLMSPVVIRGLVAGLMAVSDLDPNAAGVALPDRGAEGGEPCCDLAPPA